jgi:hypothetical protein
MRTKERLAMSDHKPIPFPLRIFLLAVALLALSLF